MVLRERFQAPNNSHVIKVIDPFIADSKVHMLTGEKTVSRRIRMYTQDLFFFTLNNACWEEREMCQR